MCKARLDSQVLSALRVALDHRVVQVYRVALDSQARRERKAFRVFRVLQVLDLPALLVLKDLRVSKVHLDSQVALVLRVL